LKLVYPSNLTRKDPIKLMLEHADFKFEEERTEKVDTEAVFP
jgi:hypothetical protein